MSFKSVITDIINKVKIKTIDGLRFDDIINNHGRVFIVVQDMIILCKYSVWYWDDPGPSRSIKLLIRGDAIYDVDGDLYYEYITPSIFHKPLGEIETILVYPIVDNIDMYPMFDSFYDAIQYLKTFKNHSKIVVVDDDKK